MIQKQEISQLLFLSTIFIFLTSCMSDVGNSPEIDLANGNEGHIVVLSAPDAKGETSSREIILPEFTQYCHVAADSNMFRWIGASNRMFPWVGKTDMTSIFVPKNPIPPRIPMPNKRALLMLFKLADGKFMTIMPLSGTASVSWLEIRDDGKLIVDYGTLGTEPVPDGTEVPLLAWAISNNIYESVAEVWKELASSKLYKDKLSLRSQKEYPEPMNYLGWCTWEQYHKNINEKIILDAIENIENSEIPVRWLLIDDGHQTLKDGRMFSLEPDKNKFPNGWDPIITGKKEDKIKWMGIWHTLLMHWNNISPDHEMTDLAPYLMPQPIKKQQDPKDNQYLDDTEINVEALIPKDNADDSEQFYKHFMKDVKAQGFDFLKTDNVSRSTIEYYGTSNPARAHTYNVLSLEKACNIYGLGLMNCSAQNTIDLLNATHSATMRTSPDYQKNNLSTSKSQILQSVFNTLWLGQTLWPDHDMFHSSDSQVGETMAITKAMSGGPIYLSDDPEDFNKEIIMPLCYDDGLLIRPEAPGAPLSESVFSDALYETKHLYKVISPLKNKACAIAAYNLSMDENAVLTANVSTDDYANSGVMIQPFAEKWPVPAEGLVVYDWGEKEGQKLDENGIDFEMKGFGHKLLLMCPVNNGWAVIGRADKYLAPATVNIQESDPDNIIFSIHEAGDFILYSAKGMPESDQVKFRKMENNFYLGQPTEAKGYIELKISRK
ncbi:MAG: Sip1-related alpha-galactosidase [Prolixibacteraceae bacterium]|nr:Sip1-related alpha-galactosidase [Prolixibacteraceae bacterium]